MPRKTKVMNSSSAKNKFSLYLVRYNDGKGGWPSRLALYDRDNNEYELPALLRALPPDVALDAITKTPRDELAKILQAGEPQIICYARRPPRHLNPCVMQVVDHYPRRGARRGRAWSQYCNALSRQVKRTLRRECAKSELTDLACRWRITQLVNWYFVFFKRHHKHGFPMQLFDPPRWLIDELRWDGSWRPKSRTRANPKNRQAS